MEKRKYFWILLCFLSFLPSLLFSQDRKNPFLVEWDDSVQKIKPGTVYTLRVTFHVHEGHYLYADKTEVKLNKIGVFQEIKTEFPKAQKHFDPFLKQDTDAYLKDFEIRILLKAPASAPLGRSEIEGEVKYQGCSSDFCYRPIKAPLLIPFDISTQASETPLLNTQNEVKKIKSESFWNIIQSGKIDKVLDNNLLLVLGFVFLAGLLTCFTPCVLPVIPLTLAVVGIKKNRSLLHNLGLSLSLVMGMSVTYAVLGLAAAFLGVKLGFLFQSKIFLIFLILFFVSMSLSLWGVFQIELPLKLRNFFTNIGGSGFQGAFLAGLSIGFIASPCVGPIIAPILLWVAKKQKIFEGMIILFVYGLGMGSLFIVMSTFYSTLAGKLRGGYYTNIIKKILACLMLLPALYYSYVVYQQYKPSGPREGWSQSLKEGLAKASQEKKPVIIDFYADWCIPCIEIDQKTFKNNEVKEALKDFVPIKINCTLETPECQEAADKYEVLGWPSIFFLNSELQIQKDLSVVGEFVGPERMLEILRELKNRSQ